MTWSSWGRGTSFSDEAYSGWFWGGGVDSRVEVGFSCLVSRQYPDSVVFPAVGSMCDSSGG